MIEEFTIKEVDSKIIDILYFDWSYLNDKNEEVQNDDHVIGPQSFKKTIHLKEYIDGTDLKKEAAEFLEQNIFEAKELPKLYSQNNIIDEPFKIKIKNKLSAISYYIASAGRIGTANNIICNTKTNEKFINDTHVNDMVIIINEFIPDDVFYIIRNTEMDEPGFKFVYYTSTEGITYYAFMPVGFFAERQAAKLIIYNINGIDDSNLNAPEGVRG